MIKVPAIMRRFAILFALLAVLSAPASAQDFVPGFEDLPLMRGLAPIAGSGHVFDSPAGRLVESHASGTVSRAEVETFYRESLVALGWSETLGGSAGKMKYCVSRHPAGTATFRSFSDRLPIDAKPATRVNPWEPRHGLRTHFVEIAAGRSITLNRPKMNALCADGERSPRRSMPMKPTSNWHLVTGSERACRCRHQEMADKNHADVIGKTSSSNQNAFTVPQPVVAAVAGYVLGGGASSP